MRDTKLRHTPALPAESTPYKRLMQVGISIKHADRECKSFLDARRHICDYKDEPGNEPGNERGDEPGDEPGDEHKGIG